MTDLRKTGRRINAGLSVASLVAAAACGGSGDATRVGTPDNPQISTLRVEESMIKGQVVSGRLRVEIPVTALGGASTHGELAVQLLSVDGQRSFGSTQVVFAVDPAQTSKVSADLPIPTEVSQQVDWAAHLLQVRSVQPPGLQVTRSLLAVVGPYNVRLEGPATINRGRPTHYRVRAEDPLTLRPLAGTPVVLIVRQAGMMTDQGKLADKVLTRLEAITGDRGDAVFDLTLDVDGAVTVEATGAAQGTVTRVTEQATVKTPGAKVLLTTDKPIYQPGQTIHLRALALDSATQRPVAPRPVVFEVQDGRGNKILKRTLNSDGYGLAATTFKLGSVLNLGTFVVRALVGEDKTEKSVEVSRYALPKFKVDIATERPYYLAGETVNGTIDARYFFGKPVADSEVVIEASALDIGVSTFARVIGRTDAVGRYAYSVMLPPALVGQAIQAGNALVSLHVAVTDTAGQKVAQDRAVAVAARSLRVALIPEATVLVPGVPNRLDAFVTDPLGEPLADVAVKLQPVGGRAQPVGDGSKQGTTDRFGHVAFDWDASQDTLGFEVSATAKDGKTAHDQFSFQTQTGQDHLLVRTDKAVYGIGDSVSVEIRTSAAVQTVYLDWLANGQVTDLRALEVRDGVARYTTVLDALHVGNNRIEAYMVDAQANIVRAGRTVFARSAGALSVELTADQPQYVPGAPAKLTLSVKDETGAPAVAALGVQIVDQAVFALVDAKPALLRTFFELSDQFATPNYQIRPPLVDVPTLLFTETAQIDHAAAAAAQVRAAATLASLGAAPITGIHKASWDGVIGDTRTKLEPFVKAEQERLRARVRSLTQAAVVQLRYLGCTPAAFTCSALKEPFLQILQRLVKQQLVAFDFWGNAYQSGSLGSDIITLTSSGPDERAQTKDDWSVTFQPAEFGLVLGGGGFAGGRGLDDGRGQGAPGGVAPAPQLPGPPNNAAAGAGGAIAGGNNGSGGANADPGSGPRVRQDFPETLYVNPSLITGPDGVATLTVDMADSITEWRVSTLAHSQGGKLGGGVGGVRVFQDFFVDIDFPATLTRGDAIAFPIAVYNYLTEAQTVHLELQPGDWFTATGATTLDVPLGPGQVTGVRFPVRVDRVGRQTLTVKAFGDKRSDAVARTVLVEPDGKAIPVARSGSLEAGSVTLPVSFPDSAIVGSQKLSLNVFPAYLSQVVQGMDSLLRVPYGCFEQTTSTAWPNVLVTDYLKQTKQLKPEIQLKAESLMSAGYQRLLTYEHRGGGFSWFGESDPAPYLSVTAFGLMEFADMSKVQTVDQAMIDRTRSWLLRQQAADGSWKGDMSEFFSFQTSLLRNTAFVVWAVASSDYKGPELAKGLAFVKKQLGSEKPDAYTLGIVANAFVSAAPQDPMTMTVLDQLAAAAKVDGAKALWDSAGTQTNFYGSGRDADVSATALAAHALLGANQRKDLVDGALNTLTSSKDPNGNFGSTQATIWALRALLLAAQKGTDGAIGMLAVEVDGTPFSSLMLTADQSDVMTTLDLASLATTGAHSVALRFAGTGKVSYNLVAQHSIPWQMMPAANGPLSVAVAYDKTTLAVDDTARATVTVRNNTRSMQNMILVSVGIPPGFKVLTDDLDTYKNKKVLSSYELTGRQLLLYVSSLAGSGALDIAYRLQATMPVRVSDGGAQAYLYYEPTQRSAAAATTLEVMAAAP